MTERLRRSGFRTIHPVVDISNYVMLELGQPLHAYDLALLQGVIKPRFAKKNEKITLLDEREVHLSKDTLVITDDSGPIGLAGIMGGLSTAVSETTKDVFFEAAFWPTSVIAGRARSYRLHTDASLRFERGVDFEGQARAVVVVSGIVVVASEVVVIADASAPVEFAAIDVVAQAEHGPDGLAWLVTWDESVADAVEAEVAAITGSSPRRGDIESTLAASGHVVLVDDVARAIEVVDRIAPEHLQLMVEDAQDVAVRVRHAGAVFCGPWSPASLGDYIAGPSHVLPTAGTARFSGALAVADFTKDIHVVTADRSALASLGPHVVALAEAEGLDAHAESVRRRLAAMEEGDDA